MMEFEHIKYDIDDNVATITLCRPEALNAITITMLQEAREAIKAASEHAEVAVDCDNRRRQVVFSGTGFEGTRRPRNPRRGDVGNVVNDPAQRLIKTIQKSPKPVIAKINGFCFTGALELVLTCDSDLDRG